MQTTAPPEPRFPIAPHRRHRSFLAASEQAALLDWTLSNEARFAPGQLKKGQVNSEIRRSKVLKDLGPLRPMFKSRLLDHLPRMTEGLGVASFAPSRIELEIVAHNDGDRFVQHIDTYRGEDRPERGDRVLSGVYYFHREPKAFGGGELRLHRFGATLGAAEDFIEIEPDQNSLVVFPSWAPHEVRPVTCPSGAFGDSRFSVNCWIYRPRGPS
jgi:Rps23 Pro-64 3,4-dihydroxylase Tpa1-like proline 4-hydroxylase